MGSSTAMAIANTPELTLEQQIGYHLQSNHYPPVPLSMVEPCIEAIDAWWEGSVNTEITLPQGVFYKGNPTAPAWAIIDQHHLDAWIIDEDIDYEEQ